MIDSRKAVKKYDLLFHLPRPSLLALAILMIGALPGFVDGYLLRSLMIFVVPSYAYSLLLLGMIKDKGLLNIRRALGISLAALCFQVLSYGLARAALLFNVLSNVNLSSVFLASCAVFTATSYTVVSGIFDQKTTTAAPSLISQGLGLTMYSAFGKLDYSLLGMFLLTQALSICVSLIALIVIDLEGVRILGLRTLRLFNAFTRTWLADNPSPLEAILSKLGVQSTIKVTTLVFESQRGIEGVFVTTTAHPGPFRNVGGSKLPAILAKRIEEEHRGCVALPFHYTTTHDYDLATREDLLKVINLVSKSISTARLIETQASPFICGDGEKARVCCQVLGVPVFTITWAARGAEDLPSYLGERFEDLAREYGFPTALVIEAHNHYRPEEAEMEYRMMEGLIEEGRKVLKETMRRVIEGVEVKAAFSIVQLPKEIKLDEIGEAEVRLAIVEVKGSKQIYVLIDGNNLLATLRRRIVNSLIEEGFDSCEVYTTDTHSTVATKAIKGGYHPVGRNIDHKKMVELIIQRARELKERMVSVSFRLGYAEDKVTVLGDKGLALLFKAVNRCTLLAGLILPIAYLTSFTLSLILTSL